MIINTFFRVIGTLFLLDIGKPKVLKFGFSSMQLLNVHNDNLNLLTAIRSFDL